MLSVKEQVRKILDELPEDCSIEDVQYRLYVTEKVRRGLASIDQGHGVDHDQAKEQLGKWLKK